MYSSAFDGDLSAFGSLLVVDFEDFAVQVIVLPAIRTAVGERETDSSAGSGFSAS